MLSTCPRCGCPNIASNSICPECSESLIDPLDAMTIKRVTLPTGGVQPADYPTVGRVAHVGKLGANSVALYPNQSDDPIIIEVLHEVTLGRRVANSGIQPDLDLSGHGAYERGVSRVHTCIRRTDAGLVIEDEGSSNGTWVNGTLLPAHSIKLLAPGDQFWLARLRLEIYFTPNVKSVSPEEPIKKASNPSTRTNFSEWLKSRSERDNQNAALNKAGGEESGLSRSQ